MSLTTTVCHWPRVHLQDEQSSEIDQWPLAAHRRHNGPLLQTLLQALGKSKSLRSCNSREFPSTAAMEGPETGRFPVKASWSDRPQRITRTNPRMASKIRFRPDATEWRQEPAHKSPQGGSDQKPAHPVHLVPPGRPPSTNPRDSMKWARTSSKSVSTERSVVLREASTGCLRLGLEDLFRIFRASRRKNRKGVLLL